MARYNPTADVKVVKPCGERWEAMPGDSRVRRCEACGRDVINAASLTPEQIEGHIRATLGGKPMPCMRLVRFEDGSLLTAQSERGLSLVQRAFAGLSAFAILATTAVAQGNASATARLRGRVVDAQGIGIPSASVTLRQTDHPDVTVKTGEDGSFAAETSPGSYWIAAAGTGFGDFSGERVVLHKGVQELVKPVELPVGAVTMGVVVVNEKPLKTRKPKKTTAAASPVSSQ